MACLLLILAQLCAALARPPSVDDPSFDRPPILSLSSLDHARHDAEHVEGSTAERSAQERPHWPIGAAILVWIDARNAPSGADGLVERAMTTWTDAAARRFHLERTSARDAASLRVHFVRGGDNLYGEAQPRVDRHTGAIVEADVHINGDMASAGDRLAQRIVLYLTALHELGHALGLPHTDDFSTIMYSFRRPDDGARYFGAYRRRVRSADEVGSAQATGLAPADVEALRALYGQ